ncbi:MAG: Ig-like domain-containing protein, partial [Candidatus Sedimenticola sp. 6PFRAG1]
TSGDIEATATDAANNTSPTTTEPYTDTTAPEAPTVDTVTVNADGTVSVSGTAEPESTVTVTFPDGDSGTFTTDADGNYGPITSDTPQTSGDIKATATDAANNTSPITTEPYTDTTAPEAPTLVTVADDQGGITGNLANNDTTDDTLPVVNVTLPATGLLPGDVVNLYDGTTIVGTYTLTQTDITNRTASVTPTIPLADGSHTLSTTIEDEAGNESASSASMSIEVDTTAPEITSVEISAATMDQANPYTIDTGDKISFEVIFDELVTVDTTNGTPLIGIKVGNDTVDANYVSGTGSDTLTFELPVLESHFDHDGVSINANALDLNGGSITTDYGLDVSTDHDAVVSDPDYRVDAIDLGTNGLLIHGYQADAKWYFAWDKNGDGVHSSGYDKGTWTQANALDGSQDANAQATLNFPSGGEDPRVFGLRPGTAVDDGPTVNTTYDGLLALWDAHNGSGTGTGGTASFNGWFDGTYHGDTQGTGAGYYVAINIGTGQVYNAAVGVPTYIAYEVL